jgi:hypothetical protein
MDGVLILLAFVAGLIVLDVLALRTGADSRPGAREPLGSCPTALR